MTKAAPVWLVPVAAIFVLQTVSAFLNRFIPIIAPAISAEFGWEGSSVGYLNASHALGSLVILLVGSNFMKAVGSMRCVQYSLLLGAACMALFLHPSLTVALVACFLMGSSNGTSTPAGSDVLQRFSPPSKRNLIFSIKQAGVPLGGIIAGLLIPPLILLSGWRTTIFICALVMIIPTLMTWKLSAVTDITAGQTKWKPHLPDRQTLRTLWVPLSSLTANRKLFDMSVVGLLFAVSQCCWFTFMVVYLIDGLGYSLGNAGLLFAVMQTGGFIGRIVLGWISDRLPATMCLSIIGVLSMITTVLMGASTPLWPTWTMVLLSFLAGGTAASWNGVHIAEIARHSPQDLISETAAGASILVNVTNMCVPAILAFLVASTQRYDIAFYACGLTTSLVLLFLRRGGK